MKKTLLNSNVLSIDFGSKEIKIVEGREEKGRLDIFKFHTIELPENTYFDGNILEKKVIVNLMKKSLDENKISTKKAYASINSSSIIIRELEIPKIDKKEIAGLIGFQIDDVFPVNSKDYNIKYLSLSESKEENMEKLDILIVGVPKSIVLEHFELMKDVGLKPKVLDFQGNTMAKLLKYNDEINEEYSIKNATIVSIDIGYNTTKISIVKDGKIEITRILFIGGKSLYNKEFLNSPINEKKAIGSIIKDNLQDLLKEIKTIFIYYKSRNNNNFINYILLQGGVSEGKGLEELFLEYFNIPIIILKSLNKIKCKEELSRYSNAIGGLIRLKKEV